MATVVGDIAIAVGADIGPLVSGLAKGQAAVSRFGSTAQAASSGGMRAMTVAGAAMAGAVVAAGLGIVALTRQSMDNIDVMSKAAKTLGIHTARLQAMAQVANEAGVETDGLTKAMVKMLDNIAGLQAGTAAPIAAFQALGLSMADLQGKGSDEQFALIAERIAAIADPAERTAAALNVFGKAGADLIPMMDGYRAALQETTGWQKEFGIAVSDTGGRDVEAANDAVGRLSIAISGLGNNMATTWAPAIDAVANKMADLLSVLIKTDDEITQMAIDATFARMKDSVSEARNSVDLLILSFGGLLNGDIGRALQLNADMIDKANQEFDDGQISASEYEKQINRALENIRLLYGTIASVDADTDMSGAIAEIDRLIGIIDIAFAAARRLAGALPGATVGTPLSGDMGSEAHGGRVYTPSGLAPTKSPRPNQPGVDTFGTDTG